MEQTLHMYNNMCIRLMMHQACITEMEKKLSAFLNAKKKKKNADRESREEVNKLIFMMMTLKVRIFKLNINLSF